MGRKQTYFCDTCETEFGNRPHINLEGIMLRVVYKVGNNWNWKRFKNKNTQYHFCNALCLTEWITTQTEGLYSQIEGGQNAIPGS